ncbi:MAG: hypothetical protein AWM53_00247 [Candidatus Dichloromethanomonas elyunquensis]|nr:MAG: hypothetical protein AWM53_00247 [Candidatus Dichloromethanomonas elyunquensis]
MKKILDLKKVRLSLNAIIIFDEILQDDRIRCFCGLLDDLLDKEPNCERILISYHIFYKSMAGINWVEYLIKKLFESEYAFTALSSNSGNVEVNDCIKRDAARDLRIIQALAEITPGDIISLTAALFRDRIPQGEEEIFTGPLWAENWPVWRWEFPDYIINETDLKDLPAPRWLEAMKSFFLKQFIHQENWESNAPLLMDYYQKAGCGIFGTFAAFKLKENNRKLEGIDNPDTVRIRNLICQEREQTLVLRNTESFLQGFPANNVILYGNRGTGKSSLVKALLNEYVAKGLRLVQLKKNQIGMFPELVKELAKIPLKFIIFIDDLSFNDVEEDYKNLKSLLEGGVESRPGNVLIYATSNRKHLVKESFSDRRSDDVQAQDNMEEKLSLADRFGITVTFLSPDQETYLRIVEGLASQHHINMERDELRQKALKWVMMHNGRSGRTARQFIDHLIGDLAVSRK